MKLFKKIKYLLPSVFVAAGSLFTSCTDDDIVDSSFGKGEGGLTLNINLPDPITIDPMTRAGVADFNEIKDLNVVIADGEGDDAKIVKVLYIDNGTPPQGEIEEGISIKSEEGRDIPSIHFDKEVYPGENIYVVANWKSKIDMQQVTSVNMLKQLQQTSELGIPVGSILFGKAESTSQSHGDNGKTMEVELLRTVAMITVVIDGTELNKNVVITPTRVSLCNVPKYCYIGKNNMDLEATNCVPNGVVKNAETMWLGSITQGQTTGKHFTTAAYDDKQVEPLFLFENMHQGGNNFGASDVTEDSQKSKRPNGVENNPNAIENGTKNCSYLKVEAEYKYTAQGKEIAGNVAFKLFLGENVTTNFDVKRNHYYKVTLNLSGIVVAEDGHKLNDDGTLVVNNTDASWRIDSKLDKVTILTGDVNINASGDFFFLELAGQDNVEWRLTSKNNNYFMWAYDDKNKYWGNFSDIGVSGKSIPQGGIMVYCDAWFEDETGSSISQQQTINLQIKNSNGEWETVKTITVTQYDPIEITLPSADELPSGLKDFANHKMWIDRIDRTAMPWGFDGTSFQTTHGTNAFWNVYNLVRKDTENGFQYNYWKRSEEYLPWGKGNGGSAMIYAICLNLYTNSAPSGTPEDVSNNSHLPTESELLNRYENNRDYLWTIPTIAGWQVIEKYASDEIADSGFPILSFNKYWTSNAVTVDNHVVGDTKGDKYAYYYQFGMGWDKIPEGDSYPYYSLREQPNLFRCIAISKYSN